MEEKSIICLVDKLQGNFTYRIDGFFGLPGREYHHSPIFSLCGRDWQLEILPRGNFNGYTSVSVHSMSEGDIDVGFDLKISCGQWISKFSKIVPVTMRGYNTDTKESFSETWNGALDYPELSRASQHRSNVDEVTINLVITIYGQIEHIADPVDTKKGSTGLTQLQPLGSCLLDMLSEQDGTDIVLSAMTEDGIVVRIPAHKLVLSARSPVFKAMFSHQMQENTSGEVQITDYTAPVVEVLLQFLYTDEIFHGVDDCDDLLRIALQYQVPDLVAQCEHRLIHSLNERNVVKRLQLASMIENPSLKRACLQYIGQNALRVSRGQDYQQLDARLKAEAEVAIFVLSPTK